MRHKHVFATLGFAALMCVTGIDAAWARSPVGSAFTYQGQLTRNGSPFTGSLDMSFSLWDALAAGNQIATVSIVGVDVADGLFTLPLDFGNGVFSGDARWLEITVGGPDNPTTLVPRQSITPAPYATAIPGVYSRPSTDNAWPSRNVIAGSPSNIVGPGVGGSSVSGGSDSSPNTVSGSISVVAGGIGNTASGLATSVGGGVQNTASGSRSTVGGGSINSATNVFSTVGGGKLNTASGDSSTVSGGLSNTASGENSTVAGGKGNIAQGAGSLAAGRSAKALHDGTFVWSDSSSNGGVQSTGTDQFLIRAGGGVGIGTSNPTEQLQISDLTTAHDSYFALKSAGGNQFRTGIKFRVFNDELGFTIENDERSASNGLNILRHSNDADGVSALFIDKQNGRVGIGTTSPLATLDVNGTMRSKIVEIMGGSDLAEPFKIDDPATITPGMVVSINPDALGGIRISDSKYDPTVAGIISGANGVNTGLMLRQPGTAADGDCPVALTGRVWCFCDADAGGAIKPGDMLTTSSTRGHAMKAGDRHRAYGATIGKALTSLESGTGMVLVLVNLQ